MPDFRDDAKLDASQVEDVRGRSLPGRGVALGGGGSVIGIVIALVVLLSGSDTSQLGPLTGLDDQTAGQPAPGPGSLARECRTGADADRSEECRIVGFVNSIQAYWHNAFDRQGDDYELARTRFFSGGVNTACGSATSASGPFYCPADRYAYIDLAFFDDLRERLGAQGGPFAQAYVLAHEYGHHVQNLRGVLGRGASEEGAQGRSVRTELQADCYAGAWAANAVRTGFLEELSEADIADGLDAAAAVGDDRIQERSQGQITPDTWTHGSSEQRQRWFTTGLRSGSDRSCDTFSGDV